MPVRPLARVLPAALAAGALVIPAVAGARTSGPAASVSRASKHCANTDVVPSRQNLGKVRRAILCLHNQIRAGRGLPLLRENAKLRRAAAGHSADMVARSFFDHTAPGGSTFVQRIFASRYASRRVAWSLGENLAWGTGDLSTPAGVMNAWMNSAGHKANILKRAYREVGVGIRLGVPKDAGVGATFTADFGAKG